GDSRDARPAVEGRDRSRRGHGLDTRSRPKFLPVEPGLYVTFFNEGEAFDRELPPVGPLEHVVVRDQMLLADRKDGETDPFVLGGRWVEAERELRRATGQEPGGTTRPDLRIGAPEGVYRDSCPSAKPPSTTPCRNSVRTRSSSSGAAVSKPMATRSRHGRGPVSVSGS